MAYNPRRKQNLYSTEKPYRLSRSKVDLFLECPYCFYLDRKIGIRRPPGYPFNLNNAVDTLLKKEFDIYRAQQRPHPLMTSHHIDAVPFQHGRMEKWRDSLRQGITHTLPYTNLIITGGVDDVWINPDGELIIVDYKATSKTTDVSLDADWQIGYKRQMEIYQWLFRQNGFKVSSTGYFVYANGDAGADAFNHCLRFDIKILPYTGDDAWIPQVLNGAYECLNQNEPPESSDECEFCAYRREIDGLADEVQQLSLL